MFFPRSKKEAEPNTTRKLEPSNSKGSNSIRIIPSTYQHIGARKQQEDAFALSDFDDSTLIEESGMLAVVADGMGGLACGEDASRVAVMVFLREYMLKEPEKTVPERLKQALVSTNTAVFDLAYQNGMELDLGTTLIAVSICDQFMHWVSVGDSRIYHFRKDILTRLTIEHIYRNKLMEDVHKGLLSFEEAENHPEGAYLTSYIGLPELPEVDRNEDPLELMPGDQVILCSDGLYNTLSDEEIRVFFLDADHINAEYLVNKVLAKNDRHQDNITVVIISCSSLGQ